MSFKNLSFYGINIVNSLSIHQFKGVIRHGHGSIRIRGPIPKSGRVNGLGHIAYGPGKTCGIVPRKYESVIVLPKVES